MSESKLDIMTLEWLSKNGFHKRKNGGWRCPLNGEETLYLIVEESNVCTTPVFAVSLTQSGRSIFLSYCKDADRISDLIKAIVSL